MLPRLAKIAPRVLTLVEWMVFNDAEFITSGMKVLSNGIIIEDLSYLVNLS